MPRLLAKAADAAVAGLFAYFVPGAGSLFAVIFLLLADAIPHGQSPGKRLVGIRVVHVPTRRPATTRQAVVRNVPVAVAAAFATNPYLALVAVPIVLFELYMIHTDALGIRIGDVFADTQVVDTKIPLAAADATPRSKLRRATISAGLGEAAELPSNP